MCAAEPLLPFGKTTGCSASPHLSQFGRVCFVSLSELKSCTFFVICPKLSRLITVILGNRKRDTVSSVASEDIFMSLSRFWRGSVVLHTFTILTSLALLHHWDGEATSIQNLSNNPFQAHEQNVLC